MAPVCVNVSLKATPAVPLFTAGFVTVMAWQAMTSVYVGALPKQPFVSVALTTIGNEPVCVGVPERTPPVDSDNPAGSALAVENVTGRIALPAVKV